MTTDTIEMKALTVNEFCAAYKISRPHFYSLLKDGRGPTTYKVSSRRFVSPQAAEEWQHKLESESE